MKFKFIGTQDYCTNLYQQRLCKSGEIILKRHKQPGAQMCARPNGWFNNSVRTNPILIIFVPILRLTKNCKI